MGFSVDSVAIVGVGLIGASFGLALKAARFRGRVVGVSSEGAVRDALRLGAIDVSMPLADAVARSGLVYLSQPIGRILETVRRLDPWLRPGTLVTDAGSTKRAIVNAAGRHIRQAQFLGGHPLAGKEKSGAAQAEADLFAGRTYVLTPSVPGELETPAARWLVEWLGRIGAVLRMLDADEHDRVVSFTSHLAQLASTALASTVSENLDPPAELAVSGPGLAGATRLALSPYDVWRDILETNADSIDRALAAYIQKLESIRENLRTRQMRDEFRTAAALASRLRR